METRTGLAPQEIFEKIKNEIGDSTYSKVHGCIQNYLKGNYESLRKNIQDITSGVSDERKKLLYSYFCEAFGFNVDDFLSGKLQEKMRTTPVIELELICLNKFKNDLLNACVFQWENPIRKEDYSPMELHYIREGLDARVAQLQKEKNDLLKNLTPKEKEFCDK